MSKEQLERAFELIQADEYEQASKLLKGILDRDPSNSDAWWLLANTVEDPREARRALVNVLKHDPKHVQAQETLETLNEQFPPRDDELVLLMELQDSHRDIDFDEPAVSEEDLAALFGDEDIDSLELEDLKELEALESDDDDFFKELMAEKDKPAKASSKAAVKAPKPAKEKQERKRSPILVPLLLIVGAALIATVLFLISGGQGDDEGDTVDKGQSDVVVLAAYQPEIPELAAAVSDTSNDARLQFGAEGSALLTATDGQQTLYVEACVCLRPDCEGPAFDTMTQVIVDSFKLATTRITRDNFVDQVPQVGVNIKACGKTDILYRAYTSVASVLAYRSNENTDTLKTFQAQWVVIEE